MNERQDCTLKPKRRLSILSVGSDGLLPARFPDRLDHRNDGVVARRPRLHSAAGQFQRQFAKGSVYRSHHPVQPSEPDDFAIEKGRLDAPVPRKMLCSVDEPIRARPGMVPIANSSRAGASDWSHPIPAAVSTASASARAWLCHLS